MVELSQRRKADREKMAAEIGKLIEQELERLCECPLCKAGIPTTRFPGK